jgi:hypothetical protein
MAMTAKERMRKYRERKRLERSRPKPCMQCRKPFSPQRTTALYCSDACRQKAFVKKARAKRLREWYAPPKWSEWHNDESVIAEVRQLDIRGPFLTRDELWLTAYIDVTNIFTNEGSVHVRVSSEFNRGELVCWIEGAGQKTYKSGNPTLMTDVVAEVAANPKAAYTRARRHIRAAGGQVQADFGKQNQPETSEENVNQPKMIPQRWARRHLGWMYADETEAEFDRRMAKESEDFLRIDMITPISHPLDEEDNEPGTASVVGEQLELI